jgi:hypothetical protein
MIAGLDSTRLWTAFYEKADDATRARVADLAEDAAEILDRIVETFPTYTLHNRAHALNVVKLMDELLGDAIESITGLEAALLILSAFFHDVGMHYREEELKTLTSDEWFEPFLRTFPDAYLEFEETHGTVTPALAERYCRWRHADRVFSFLDAFPESTLTWGVVSLRDKLGELCRSHNLSTPALRDDSTFETNFLQQCDLRFCAILLRLADILDFDRSRSPEFVYQYLGFPVADSDTLRRSNDEWRKHQASEGFRFPPSPRDVPYKLAFIAAPDNPNIDHDIRTFLDVIDGELTACAALLQTCSPRWRTFALPSTILREIRPRGYHYGEYQFALDRQSVLQLFMGEKMYNQSYVFVRELLQNAIDTTRHRVAIERSRGGNAYEPAPIEFSEWSDGEGYRWVRIDDFGMGMNDDLIQRYFLAIGRSYYHSRAFRAEMLRASATIDGYDFAPISQFGIGVLSCFIVGDIVEVSTRMTLPTDERSPPIRLSLRGLESFYVLQIDPMHAEPMPSAKGDEQGYRRQPGTSIAVRLDPTNDFSDFDLLAVLRQYLFASTVPVRYLGAPVETSSDMAITTRWFDGPRTIPVGNADARSFAVAEPLDLTAVTPDQRIEGQMALLAYPRQGFSMESSVQNGRWNIRRSDPPSVVASIDLGELFGTPVGRIAAEALRMPFVWGQSGVTLPDLLRIRVEEDGTMVEANLPMAYLLELPYSFAEDYDTMLVGCLRLADDLPIELSVSRDVAQVPSWNIWSAFQMGLIRACETSRHPLSAELARDGHLPLDLDFLPTPPLGVLLDDPLLLAGEGWLDRPLLQHGMPSSAATPRHAGPRETVAEVIYAITIRGEERFLILPHPTKLSRDNLAIKFGSTIACALAQTQIGLTWAEDKTGTWGYRGTGIPSEVDDSDRLLPPLAILPYEHNDALRIAQGPMNRDHPMTRWLKHAMMLLREERPGMLNTLLRLLRAPYAEDGALANRVNEINVLLERLRAMNSAASPSSSLSVTGRDFR